MRRLGRKRREERSLQLSRLLLVRSDLERERVAVLFAKLLSEADLHRDRTRRWASDRSSGLQHPRLANPDHTLDGFCASTATPGERVAAEKTCAVAIQNRLRRGGAVDARIVDMFGA